MDVIYCWLTIILNLILFKLSGIESASGEDSSETDPASGEDESGIEPASGEDESGEDESGIGSGSGAGIFCLFLTLICFGVVFPKWILQWTRNTKSPQRTKILTIKFLSSLRFIDEIPTFTPNHIWKQVNNLRRLFVFTLTSMTPVQSIVRKLLFTHCSSTLIYVNVHISIMSN